MFFNYAKLAHILTDHCHYAGELQIILRSGERTEKDELWVLVSADGLSQSDNVRDIILSNYADLRECVQEDKLLDLRIVFIAPDRFQRTAGSGKLRRIIDERVFLRKP
jgi:hypothetical protein